MISEVKKAGFMVRQAYKVNPGLTSGKWFGQP
jgi:hypothetical protein